MNFEFATATRIIFGPGRIADLSALARQFGSCALVVTGRGTARSDHIVTALGQEGIATHPFAIIGEPDIATVQVGAAVARDTHTEFIISIGGGSAMDAGKAIAALATNPGDIFDYLEVIGKAQPLSLPALPIIAIPTTAGTGAEVTRNAVIHSPEHRVKVSLRSAHMLPRVALIDPELTRGLPPALTATTGLDALTQLIEPFVSRRANPVTDALCREGISRAGRSLRRAFENGDDLDARRDMALASLLGGMALANAGLGAVHGFAAPIGGMFPSPHGAVCAALLPEVMETNIRFAQQQKAVETTRRYNEVARLLTGVPTARASDGVQWVRDLCGRLQVGRLSALGVEQASFEEVAAQAEKSNSMKGNPVELTPAQLGEVLERAF